MKKISMPNPIAELDGDEMTRIIWAMIKDELIKPFVELNTEYYDLSIQNRENTKDQVTVEAAEAIKRLKVGVKCATITPNLQRQQEYHLTKLWRSPNATIRAALDGTVFRTPILISKVKPVVSCWKKPITIARHAYGDIYRAVEYRVECPGKAELLFTDENGRELSRQTIFDFTYGFPPRIPYPKTMTRPSSCSSRRFLTRNTARPLSRQAYATAMPS